jgi:hypothetical protein
VLDDGQHAACVDAWLRPSENLTPEILARLFDAALRALWKRTKTTLGDVTLTAIAERVLYNAAEKFPFLSALKVEPTTGFQCRSLFEQKSGVSEPLLRQGIRFVLVEFLTVIGNLTADILTPELHSELLRVALPGVVLREKSAQGSPARSVDAEGEDKP